MSRSRNILALMTEDVTADPEESARNYQAFWQNFAADISDRFPTETVRDAVRDKVPYFKEKFP